MRIEGHHRKWKAHDETALERVLQFRDSLGGAMFWLARDEHDYPHMALRMSGDRADVHYFPHEGHPGFRAMAEQSVTQTRQGQTIAFLYEGCDPATGEATPSEFVLAVSTAVDVAKDFHRTGARSSAVSWFEL